MVSVVLYAREFGVHEHDILLVIVCFIPGVIFSFDIWKNIWKYDDAEVIKVECHISDINLLLDVKLS